MAIDYFSETGFHCLSAAGPLGALCGYVGVPCEHPMFEKKYIDCILPTAKSRGERSSDRESTVIDDYIIPPPSERTIHRREQRLECGEEGWCAHTPESILTCHGGVTYSDRHVEGMREDYWYFGFDCSHAGDYVPGMASYGGDGVWRDEQFVALEIDSLEEQLRNYVLVLPMPRKAIAAPEADDE